jgi:hypothetical protein
MHTTSLINNGGLAGNRYEKKKTVVPQLSLPSNVLQTPKSVKKDFNSVSSETVSKSPVM